MKRKVIILLLALFAFTAAQAQQISVVSTSGSTHLYSTLKEAIDGASSGSVIYLPGGGFPVGDTVKITKKVTIIGIGHKSNNDNVDGNTIIGGNLWFNQGSSGSAVMGCYISDAVNIGEDGIVNNVLIKLCNVNSVIVRNPEIVGTFVNQNFIRGGCDFGNSNVTFTNNIASDIHNISSGQIFNNILTYSSWIQGWTHTNFNTIGNVNNAVINNNIIRGGACLHSGNNCQVSGNLVIFGTWGDNPITISDVDENDIFKNLNGWAVNPMSDFHFKETYSQYENQVGIYAGTGFSDSQLPPTPYIVGKIIPDNTDAAGKLNIRVRVKASSNE